MDLVVDPDDELAHPEAVREGDDARREGADVTKGAPDVAERSGE